MPCGRFASPPPQRRMRRGCCFGASRAGGGRRAGYRPPVSWTRSRRAAGCWSPRWTCTAARSPLRAWPRSGSPNAAARANSATTSPVTGVAGPPVSCGRRPTGSPCSAPSPTPSRTSARRASKQHSRARPTAALPTASPTHTTPTCRRSGTSGCSPCTPRHRCALRLPTRALVGLLGGAVAESWRLRATGPLREALRRRLVVRPRHLDAPYLRYTDTELTSLVAEYAAAGVRLRIHALGNLAGAQAARVLRGVGVPPDAATIDHLLLLDPATADRVASTGVAVSYQPGFLPRYGTMLQAARADRYVTVLGGRLLLQAGVPLALSSDHPCGPVDPLHNLRAAVERRLPTGQQLQPEQTLTRTEAVRAATVTAATSLQAPGGGGLAPGQAADLVICDGDPFQEGTRVTQTWIGGKLAWQAPEATGGRPSTPTRR